MERDELLAVINRLSQDDRDVLVAELDDTVHDLKSQEASAINNAGPGAQLDYLGVETVKDELDALIDAEVIDTVWVTCSLCKKDTPSETAHLHQKEWIGECCWDDRLKSSE